MKSARAPQGVDAGGSDSGSVAPSATDPVDASRLIRLVGYAASRAAITMRRVFVRHLGPLDLKVVDYSVLALVASNPQINPKRLGEALDISPPNMAVTLDRMAGRGWIQRVRSRHDGRAIQIHLTPDGTELMREADRIAASMEDAHLRMLSPAERALLIELLLKVAAGPAA